MLPEDAADCGRGLHVDGAHVRAALVALAVGPDDLELGLVVSAGVRWRTLGEGGRECGIGSGERGEEPPRYRCVLRVLDLDARDAWGCPHRVLPDSHAA